MNKESASITLLGTQALMASAISLRPVTMVVAESTTFLFGYLDSERQRKVMERMKPG
jgi:hypothetical protein